MITPQRNYTFILVCHKVQCSLPSSSSSLEGGGETLDIYQQSKVTVSGLGFIDDTSVLCLYGNSTAENMPAAGLCAQEILWDVPKDNGAKFAPEKSEPKHMTRLRRYHDISNSRRITNGSEDGRQGTRSAGRHQAQIGSTYKQDQDGNCEAIKSSHNAESI